MRFVTLVALLCWATSAAGQQPVVVRNDAIMPGGFTLGGNFSLITYNDPFYRGDNSGGTAGFFYADGLIKDTGHGTLDAIRHFYVAQFGDVLSASSIDAGKLHALSTELIAVGPGDFYLGLRVNYGATAYGWVHLRPVNGKLTLVENVMAYYARGIVVGTTTIVPEPTSALLVSVAAIVLAPLRIARKKRIPPRTNARQVGH